MRESEFVIVLSLVLVRGIDSILANMIANKRERSEWELERERKERKGNIHSGLFIELFQSLRYGLIRLCHYRSQ